jgi:hypothetical protein
VGVYLPWKKVKKEFSGWVHKCYLQSLSHSTLKLFYQPIISSCTSRNVNYFTVIVLFYIWHFPSDSIALKEILVDLYLEQHQRNLYFNTGYSLQRESSIENTSTITGIVWSPAAWI